MLICALLEFNIWEKTISSFCFLWSPLYEEGQERIYYNTKDTYGPDVFLTIVCFFLSKRNLLLCLFYNNRVHPSLGSQ